MWVIIYLLIFQLCYSKYYLGFIASDNNEVNSDLLLEIYHFLEFGGGDNYELIEYNYIETIDELKSEINSNDILPRHIISSCEFLRLKGGGIEYDDYLREKDIGLWCTYIDYDSICYSNILFAGILKGMIYTCKICINTTSLQAFHSKFFTPKESGFFQR